MLSSIWRWQSSDMREGREMGRGDDAAFVGSGCTLLCMHQITRSDTCLVTWEQFTAHAQ